MKIKILSAIFCLQTVVCYSQDLEGLKSDLGNLEGKLRNLATDLDNLKKVPLKDTKKEIEELVENAQKKLDAMKGATSADAQRDRALDVFAIIEKVIATINESSLAESFINKIVKDLQKVLNNVNEANERYDGQFLEQNDKNRLNNLLESLKTVEDVD